MLYKTHDDARRPLVDRFTGFYDYFCALSAVFSTIYEIFAVFGQFSRKWHELWYQKCARFSCLNECGDRFSFNSITFRRLWLSHSALVSASGVLSQSCEVCWEFVRNLTISSQPIWPAHHLVSSNSRWIPSIRGVYSYMHYSRILSPNFDCSGDSILECCHQVVSQEGWEIEPE